MYLIKFLMVMLMFCGFMSQTASAQLMLGGTLDFELRKGGADSHPLINQTPQDNFSIYIPTIRIFGNADISSSWHVQLGLQADYYSGETLGSPFISLANVNWIPIPGSDLALTGGRFITPYGRYSHRILSTDNPFVHLPISHSVHLPVDEVRGFYPGELNYYGFRGHSLIYQRMYSQGLMVSNSAFDGGIIYELAATLSPASGYFETPRYNTPAFIGRVELIPVYWSEFGMSASYGSFMSPSQLNAAISPDNLRSYKQLLLGADATFSYLYYTFSADINYNRWEAPYFNESWELEHELLELSALHLTAELEMRFEFLPGSYGAIRYDILRPNEIKGYGVDSSNIPRTLAADIDRMEFVWGYNINRDVTFKTSYLLSRHSGAGFNDLSDDVFALQLSIIF